MITIGELIEKLREYDEDELVYVAVDEESDGVDFHIEKGSCAIFFVAEEDNYEE